MYLILYDVYMTAFYWIKIGKLGLDWRIDQKNKIKPKQKSYEIETLGIIHKANSITQAIELKFKWN